MNIINNSQSIGSLSKDLILNTSGKVYIRVDDRYYELNFKDDVKTDTSEHNIENNEKLDSDIVITKSISDIEYPGDNKLIITTDGKFYITKDAKYRNVTPKQSSQSVNKDAVITSLSNVDVNGTLSGDNLMLNFSTGEIRANKLIVNELISNTSDDSSYVSGSGKLYIGPEIKIINVETDDTGFVYFFPESDFDVSLFPEYELVTDEKESFVAEVLESTDEYIKTRLISGNPYDANTLILKGDSIEYHPKWRSLYNKLYNIRFDNVAASGEYLDLEFITVSSDVELTLKPGTFIKCLHDCKITVDVNKASYTYDLIDGMLYLLTDTNCYNLLNSILFFNTKEEFYASNVSESDLAFIKDTEQLYYKGLFIGGKKQDSTLPPNFKIETATEGSLIVYKNGVWQPANNYATIEYTNSKIEDAAQYTDRRLSEVVTNSPDLLALIERIADILTINDGAVVDLLYAIDNLRSEFDEKLTEKANLTHIESIYDEIGAINDRISNIELGNESDGLTQYDMWRLLARPGVEQINTERIPDLSEKYLSINGGTIQGSVTINAVNDVPLIIKRQTYPYIKFEKANSDGTQTNWGCLGFSAQDTPAFATSNADKYIYYKLLHEGNYNQFSPTLTGVGATGTWNIDISGSASKVNGYSPGVTANTLAIYVDFPSYTSLKNQGYLNESYGTTEYGHPDEEFLQAICKWAIDKYNNHSTLVGYVTPNSSGTCILHLYGKNGKDEDTLLPKYCGGMYVPLYGNVITFGSIDGVWRYHTSAWTTQIPVVTNYYWANVPIGSKANTTTAPIFGNASANRLTITSQLNELHLAFTRHGTNYITFPSDGTLAFGTANGADNISYEMSHVRFSPNVTGVIDLGRNTKRWNTIYGTVGDFQTSLVYQLRLIRNSDTSGAYIRYENLNGVLGYLGISNSQNLLLYKGDQTSQPETILTSDNYTDYSYSKADVDSKFLSLSGGQLHDGANIKLQQYGTRYVTFSASGTTYDFSSDPGTWKHGIYIKDSLGVDNGILVSRGNASAGLQSVEICGINVANLIHTGNFADTTDNRYVKLSGGKITADNRALLSLNDTNSSASNRGAYITMRSGNSANDYTAVGRNTTLGSFLDNYYNGIAYSLIISNDGQLTFRGNQVVDAGNYSSYALSLSGGTIKSARFSPLAVDRDSDTGAAAIGFMRKDTTLGFIGFNDTTGPKWFNAAYTESPLIHSGNIDSYNAGSATKLQTARTIWGKSFDGTADINGDPNYINNTALFFNDTTGAKVNAFYFNTGNALQIGKGVMEKGYSTQICGKSIFFSAGTSAATALQINSDVSIKARTILPYANLEYNLGNPDNSWGRVFTRYIDTLSGYNLVFCTGGEERMRISNSGFLLTNNGFQLLSKINPTEGESSTTVNLLEFSSANALHIGYGLNTSANNTFIYGGAGITLRYGEDRKNGLTINSTGYVKIFNSFEVDGHGVFYNNLRAGYATLDADVSSKIMNQYGSVGLRVGTSGNRGVYNYTDDFWLIYYHAPSNSTHLQGGDVRFTKNIYVAESIFSSKALHTTEGLYCKNTNHLYIANNPTAEGDISRYISAVYLNSNNKLFFGYGMLGRGYQTSICGDDIMFQYGEGSISMRIQPNDSGVAIHLPTTFHQGLTANLITTSSINVNLLLKTKRISPNVSDNSSTLIFLNDNLSGRFRSPADSNDLPVLGSMLKGGVWCFGPSTYGAYIWTQSNGQGYIQLGRADGETTSYALNLNPFGGDVKIGSESATVRINGQAAFSNNKSWNIISIRNNDPTSSASFIGFIRTKEDGNYETLGYLGFVGVDAPAIMNPSGSNRYMILHANNYTDYVYEKEYTVGYEGVIGANNILNKSIGYTYVTEEHGGAHVGGVISFGTPDYYGQLNGDILNHAVSYRYYNKDIGAFSDWKQLAFIDSNVASASQLQTSRSIWGQSFNGTQDISGDLIISTQMSLSNACGWDQVAFTGGWARGIRYKDSSRELVLARIGAYGIDDTLKYIYLTAGDLGSANSLLVYPNGTIGACSILPHSHITYDLGDNTHAWQKLYVRNIYSSDSYHLRFYTGGTERMYIDASTGDVQVYHILRVSSNLRMKNNFSIQGYDIDGNAKSLILLDKNNIFKIAGGSASGGYETHVYGGSSLKLMYGAGIPGLTLSGTDGSVTIEKNLKTKGAVSLLNGNANGVNIAAHLESSANGAYSTAIGRHAHTGVVTDDDAYPYARMHAWETEPVIVNGVTQYGIVVPPSSTVAYTYDDVQYSIENVDTTHNYIFVVINGGEDFVGSSVVPFNKVLLWLNSTNEAYASGPKIASVKVLKDGIFGVLLSTWTASNNPDLSSSALLYAMKKDIGSTYSGLDAFAWGYSSVVGASYACALGYGAVSTGAYATAIGVSAYAISQYAFAQGSYNTAANSYAVAIGRHSMASGASSVSIGTLNLVSGPYAFAIGTRCKTTGSYANTYGYATTASYDYSSAFGNYTVSGALYQTVMGKFNAVTTDAFVLGWGSGASDRKNIFTINGEGHATLTKGLTIGSSVLTSTSEGVLTANSQFVINPNLGESIVFSLHGSAKIYQHLYFANNKRLYITDSESSNLAILYVNTFNNIVFGYGGMLKGYETSIYGGSIGFYTAGDDSVTKKRLRITKNGTVIIGDSTEDTNYYLQVGGNTLINGTLTYTESGSSSDIKFKNNIQNIDNIYAMNVIRQLNPTTWTWKNNDVESCGFIAQEVMNIVPNMIESVSGNLYLKYDQIHAYSVGAIKYIDDEITTLKQQLSLANDRIAKLEDKLKEYEQDI